MSGKKPGKRAIANAQKSQLRIEINELQQRITAARSASKVPDRVVNGDAIVAANWKDRMESVSGVYHANNPVAAKCTVDYLASVKQKLEQVVRDLT